MIFGNLSRRQEYLLALFMLTIVGLILFGSSLGGFWRNDDTAILYHLLTRSLLSVFISPASWQELSPANLTPLLTFSYAIDYAVAGLSPALYYLHQLVIIILTAWLTYLLLASRVARPFALAGSLLFILGTPTANVASQLMTRHYAEGLLLSLVACLLFSIWQQKHTWPSLAGCLVCYALAMTAKEIYVPLGIFFLVQVWMTKEKRFQRSLPFLALILGYIIWRGYMLNTMVGGYTDSSQYLSLAFWEAAFATFLSLPSVLLGRHSLYFSLIALVLIVAGLIRLPKYRLNFLLVAALIAAPLLPLVLFPGITGANRYLYLPWFAVSYSLALFGGLLYRQFTPSPGRKTVIYVAGSCAVVLIGMVLAHQYAAGRARQNILTESDTQMRFVWENNDAVSFRPTGRLAGTFWLIRASGKIKSLMDPADSIPVAITDELFLSADRPLFEYSRDCQCMMVITEDVNARLSAYREKLRPDAPLSVSIENNQGFLTWSFTAAGQGRFNLVTDARGNISAPAMGRARTNLHEDTDFYLRFTSAEGWITYSPLLTIYADGRTTNWSRE